MDVVRNEIVALGGRVDVHTQPGKGTRFNLFLPLTLAVAQAVLVRAGGRMWAIPAPMVEQVQQIKADVLQHAVRRRPGALAGTRVAVPLPAAAARRQPVRIPETGRYNAVLLIRSGQGTTAIHVDEMVGNQEVVVKNIGPQLARVPGISGATVLGTGEIVLIINPVQLAQRPGVMRYDPAEDERLTAELRQGSGRVGAQARDGRRRLADGAQVHDAPADARRLRGGHGARRRRCAEAADRARAGRDPARHRNAAHGRLRVREDDQGRSEERATSRSS